jgi:hypothetical protein
MTRQTNGARPHLTSNPSADMVCGRAVMRWPLILCVGASAGLLAGCGGSSSNPQTGDRSSIIHTARSYFVFDASPDRDTYCASYVELQRSDRFGAGAWSTMPIGPSPGAGGFGVGSRRAIPAGGTRRSGALR